MTYAWQSTAVTKRYGIKRYCRSCAPLAALIVCTAILFSAGAGASAERAPYTMGGSTGPGTSNAAGRMFALDAANKVHPGGRDPRNDSNPGSPTLTGRGRADTFSDLGIAGRSRNSADARAMQRREKTGGEVTKEEGAEDSKSAAPKKITVR